MKGVVIGFFKIINTKHLSLWYSTKVRNGEGPIELYLKFVAHTTKCRENVKVVECKSLKMALNSNEQEREKRVVN